MARPALGGHRPRRASTCHKYAETYTVRLSSVQEIAIELRPRPKDFDEIRAHPRFSEVLDESAHRLAGVFTDYFFKAEVPCGLQSCRRPHKWGYWVGTEDGVETIIGNRCGKKYFPEFASKRDEYKDRRQREELLARFGELSADSWRIEGAIRTLMLGDGGELWVRKARAALEDFLGGEQYRALGFHQRRGPVEVRVQRERSNAEVDQLWYLSGERGSKAALRVEEKVVGYLSSAAWTYYDFRGVLVRGLLDQVKGLRAADPTLLSNTSLRRLVKPFDGWDRKIDEAERMVADTRAFFGRENLELLATWIREPGRRRRLTEWIERGGPQRLLGAA